MQVFLPQGLQKAVQLKLKLTFVYSSYEGSDRMGVLETKNGKIFTIAQW
jgi:hypothetical protein